MEDKSNEVLVNANDMNDKIQIQPFEPSLMTTIIDVVTCPCMLKITV